MRRSSLDRVLLLASLALINSSCFFSFERHKAQKVKAQLEKMNNIYSPKMWYGDIGRNIVPARTSNMSLVKNLGHTIECDLNKCYDTLSNSPRGHIGFDDKNFSRKLTTFIQRGINSTSSKSCGVAYLIFHQDIPYNNYAKVLRVLGNLQCGAEVVAQKPSAFPEWPTGKKAKPSMALAAKTLQGQQLKRYEEDWFRTAQKNCSFIKSFKQKTKSKRKLIAKEKILQVFADPKAFDELNICRDDSEAIVTSLRAYIYGYEDHGQLLYSKSISFAKQGKVGDIKLHPRYRTWKMLVDELVKKEKFHQYINL